MERGPSALDSTYVSHPRRHSYPSITSFGNATETGSRRRMMCYRFYGDNLRTVSALRSGDGFIVTPL